MRLLQSDHRQAAAMTILAMVISVGALFMPNGWWLLGSFCMFQVYWIAGLSAGNHRYFTHRSFETTPFWREFMIWATCTSLSGHPGFYAIIHLEHHLKSDQPDDPHHYYAQSGMVSFKNINVKMTPGMKRRFISDPIMMRTYRYYFAYSFAAIVLLSLISLEALIYLWALPVVAMQFARKYVTIKWIHEFGYVSYETGEGSKNSKILGWLFGGEGLHNNHHKFPNRWNFAIKKWEVDPTSWFVRMIKK